MLKVHYEKHVYGDFTAIQVWESEGLISGKVKFCDDLMLKKGRELGFTSKTDDVDCKKCQKKIELWCIYNVDLPY